MDRILSGDGTSTRGFVRIDGETHYLWRAAGHEGEVLEVFATKRRDRRAALKFLKRAMKVMGVHVWTAPALQGGFDLMTLSVGCGGRCSFVFFGA